MIVDAIISTTENHLRRTCIALFALSFALATAAAQEGEPLPSPTNLELIQRLTKQVSDTVVAFAKPGDSVRVILQPMESAWYIQGIVLQSVSESGRFPTQSLSSSYEMELGMLTAQVTYASVHRKGLFGAKVFDRSIKVEFFAKVIDKHSGTILLNENIHRSVNDIVDASEVERLENPAIPATHGALPREGFFSTLLEPLAALGAIAVAVYLLFHVRS